MFEFKMPKLGADMDEGVLLEWKVATGDPVKKGDIVAVVETSKGAIDIEVFTDGVVDSLLAEPGSVIAVGTVIAKLRISDAGTNAAPAPTFAMPIARSAATWPESSGRTCRSEATATGIRVSPRARKLANELKVALASVHGTGPGGSIVAEDVHAAANSESSSESKKIVGQRTAMRNTIAVAMSRAKREIPHYYLAQDVDVTALLSFVENWNDSHTVADRILPALLYYKAVGVAAKEFDSMNGYFTNDSFQPSATVNLGIAVSLRGGGLIAPCLMEVPDKPALELMRELKDLVRRARTGGLKSSEMSNGTVTISNLGDRGVDFLAGVIYPPQVALVGIGTVRARPWVVDGKMQVRQILRFSLSADHRVSDGHTGALFLRRIEQLIGAPDELM